MRYLTPKDVLQIHFEIVEATGGAQGLRDLGLLEAAVLRPQTTLDGEDLYTTLTLKAAALVHSLLLNHMFVDGNKRTAITSMITFLSLNNFNFKSTNKEFVDFGLWLENQKPNLEEIAAWIETHTK